MNVLDAVEFAEILQYPPMIAQHDNLVESLHVSAVLNVVHGDFDGRATSSSRWCLDVPRDCAGVNDHFVGTGETNQSCRLILRPQHLRGNTE